ncbi:TIGR04255 family protein [Paraburkholderia caledonica]|uniref:TIGR04255 family protein n=1 Tax=Paraburkholderia caledonica TaxID=134536 RepID=UPI0013E033BC|nr:TIGR04255 family protein [Paraburkholderia caledonica]
MLEDMNKPTVFPIRGSHSVKNVVFVCELASHLAPSDLEKIVSVYERDAKLKAFLPVKVEQRGAVSIMIQSGNGPVPTAKPNNDLVGLGFNRIAPDGSAEWALNLAPNAVIVACHQYNRWVDAVGTVLPVLRQVLEVSPHIGVSTIGLQYLDEWNIAAAEGEPIAPLLFNPAAQYIPQRLMGQSGAWHNHCGYFDTSDAALPRVLVNVNVNVNADPVTGRYTAALNHAQRSFQLEPLFIGGDVEAFSAKIEQQFTSLHQRNKQLLGEVLSEAVQNQISLFAAP